jgi:hypothetical protein
MGDYWVLGDSVPRTCRACFSSERETIDKALFAGEALRNIAKRVSISPAGLLRHKTHLSRTTLQASERQGERLGNSLVDEMRRVQKKAWELLARTESAGDHRGAIVALREVRECLESLGEMLARPDAAVGSRITLAQVLEARRRIGESNAAENFPRLTQ